MFKGKTPFSISKTCIYEPSGLKLNYRNCNSVLWCCDINNEQKYFYFEEYNFWLGLLDIMSRLDKQIAINKNIKGNI